MSFPKRQKGLVLPTDALRRAARRRNRNGYLSILPFREKMLQDAIMVWVAIVVSVYAAPTATAVCIAEPVCSRGANFRQCRDAVAEAEVRIIDCVFA